MVLDPETVCTCDDCEHEFMADVSDDDNLPVCPECGSEDIGWSEFVEQRTCTGSLQMGIEKVRIARCDGDTCINKDIHPKDCLSPGWGHWHVVYIRRGRKDILAKSKVASSMYSQLQLLCPDCADELETVE